MPRHTISMPKALVLSMLWFALGTAGKISGVVDLLLVLAVTWNPKFANILFWKFFPTTTISHASFSYLCLLAVPIIVPSITCLAVPTDWIKGALREYKEASRHCPWQFASAPAPHCDWGVYVMIAV